MAIIAPVENGKVVEDTTKANKKDDKNTADKEMFLKLWHTERRLGKLKNTLKKLQNVLKCLN